MTAGSGSSATTTGSRAYVPDEYLEKVARLLADAHRNYQSERTAQRPRKADEALAIFRAHCRGAAMMVGTIGYKFDRVVDLAFKQSDRFPASGRTPFEKHTLYMAEVHLRIVAGIRLAMSEVGKPTDPRFPVEADS